MNKKFKRALSSILAFAMVLSMMTVLNVSTAFATYYVLDTSNLNDNIVFWDFVTGAAPESSKSDTTGTVNVTINGMGTGVRLETQFTNTATGVKTKTASSSTTGYKWNAIGNVTDISSKNYIKIPVSVGDKLYAYVSTNSGNDSTSDGNVINVSTSTDISTEEDGSSSVIYSSNSGTGGNEIIPKRYSYIELAIDVTATSEDGYVYMYATGANTCIYGLGRYHSSTDPSLKISPATLSVEQGSTGTITASKSNITDSIEWSITPVDENVTLIGTSDTGATVNVTEAATAGSTYTVKAAAGGKEATCTVTVTEKANVEVSIDLSDTTMYVGQNSFKPTATVTGATDTSVTWSATKDGNEDIVTLAVDSNNANKVTVTAAKAGTSVLTATSNADSTKSASVTVTVKAPAMVSGGVTGTVNDLAAATKTKIYHLLTAADEAKAAGDGNAESGSHVYETGKLFENGEIAVVGGNNTFWNTGKTTYNIDGTTNSNGVRVKSTQDVLALKLAPNSTVVVDIASGGGSKRTAYIAESAGASTYLTSAEFSANGAHSKLTYTNDTNADKIVYISATGDSFLSEIQVIVPTCESEIKTVGNSTYVIFKITEAQRAAASSFDVVKTLDGTSVVSGEATVYTGIDFDSADTADDVTAVDGTYVIAYLIGSITDGATDVATKFDIKFN